MKLSQSIPALAVAAGATLLAGCASLPEQQAQQTAYSTQCKIVLVDTASQEISGYVRDTYKAGAPDNSKLEQTYAVNKVGRIASRNTRTPNIFSDAWRGC